jgi:hypothetical protein
MRQAFLGQFDRLALRFRQILLRGAVPHRWLESFDIIEAANMKAALESADYYEKHLLRAKILRSDLEGLSHAISLAGQDGLVLEFGVATGRTINHIASLRRGPVYGFDSFEGLPEDWRGDHMKGKFAAAPPSVRSNVQLVQGWFDDTLPGFLADHPGPVTLLHVDCDLYSSTKFIFDTLRDRIGPGCVIVFDEYWNYPGWKEDEAKAFEEFTSAHGVRFRFESFVRRGQQVTVVIE